MSRKTLAPTEPLDDTFHVPDASARGFVDAYFGPVDFGHAPRDRAFQRVAERICRHPCGALPDKMGDKAGYYAMDRPEVTRAAVLGPHRLRTFEKMAACAGPVLVLHDTTVLDYSGKNLVRSAHNRCVRLGHDGQGALTKLHAHLRSLPAMGETRTKTIFDGKQGCAGATTGGSRARVR